MCKYPLPRVRPPTVFCQMSRRRNEQLQIAHILPRGVGRLSYECEFFDDFRYAIFEKTPAPFENTPAFPVVQESIIIRMYLTHSRQALL